MVVNNSLTTNTITNPQQFRLHVGGEEPDSRSMVASGQSGMEEVMEPPQPRAPHGSGSCFHTHMLGGVARGLYPLLCYCSAGQRRNLVHIGVWI